MRSFKRLLLFVCIAAAAFAMLYFGAAENNEPEFTVFSTGPNGAGLFYDTLKKLNYPVVAWNSPVNAESGVHDAYVVIMPDGFGRAEVSDAFEFVSRGGRLIYLDDDNSSEIRRALREYPFDDFGELRGYRIGVGEIVTGGASGILNANLMNESAYARAVARILSNWKPGQIRFAEYYHGYRSSENLFSQMPAIIKLVFFQIIFIALIMILHFGKRFGKPVPLYEETERAGDEYVRALAGFYLKAGLHKKKKAEIYDD